MNTPSLKSFSLLSAAVLLAVVPAGCAADPDVKTFNKIESAMKTNNSWADFTYVHSVLGDSYDMSHTALTEVRAIQAVSDDGNRQIGSIMLTDQEGVSKTYKMRKGVLTDLESKTSTRTYRIRKEAGRYCFFPASLPEEVSEVYIFRRDENENPRFLVLYHLRRVVGIGLIDNSPVRLK